MVKTIDMDTARNKRSDLTPIKLSSTSFVLVLQKSSNQNAVFIGNDTPIGYFSSSSTKFVI